MILMKDVSDQICPKLRVEFPSLFLVWARGGSSKVVGVQGGKGEVVDVDPDGPSPVIFSLPIVRIRSTKGTKTPFGPELIWVTHNIENITKLGRIPRNKAQNQRKKGDVPMVTDGDGVPATIDSEVTVGLILLIPVEGYVGQVRDGMRRDSSYSSPSPLPVPVAFLYPFLSPFSLPPSPSLSLLPSRLANMLS